MQQDYTEIVVILDRSGSMERVLGDTIGGFNSFLRHQRAAPGRANLTLVQFANSHEVIHEAVPIRDVPDLNEQTYKPRGGTALLDAIGATIHRLGTRLSAMRDEDRPGKVIVSILTDGKENASCEYRIDQVNAMITHQRVRYLWEFIFLGANQDAITSAATMGISPQAAMNYAANAAGTRSAFAAMSSATSAYRAGGEAKFTPEEKKCKS